MTATTAQVPPFDARALRTAFGSFLTGVTVVTARDGAGRPVGFTANSFTSVSIDPPLLLVSISNRSSNLAIFAEGAGFAVNILAEGQKDLSNTFARPVDDRFAGVVWDKGPVGSPILAGVASWFDCTLHQVIAAGDHTLLVGQIGAFGTSDLPGLGYWRGSYLLPSAATAALAAGPDVMISAIIERRGQVLLEDDGMGGLTLPMRRAGREGAHASLSDLMATRGCAAVPGPIYAVYDDPMRHQQHIAFRCTDTGDTPPTKGAFVDLEPQAFGDVTDPALRVMLERLASETRLGNFGIYFGTHEAGQIAPLRSDAPISAPREGARE